MFFECLASSSSCENWFLCAALVPYVNDTNTIYKNTKIQNKVEKLTEILNMQKKRKKTLGKPKR